jgi:hypothetical protein
VAERQEGLALLPLDGPAGVVGGPDKVGGDVDTRLAAVGLEKLRGENRRGRYSVIEGQGYALVMLSRSR